MSAKPKEGWSLEQWHEFRVEATDKYLEWVANNFAWTAYHTPAKCHEMWLKENIRNE